MVTSAPTYDIPVIVDHAHRRHLLGAEPIVFHCHHYNTFLQRSIKDAIYIDSTPFLVGAAAEVAVSQLRNLFGEIPNVGERSRLAERIYSWAGFGRVDLSGLTEEGGVVEAPSSHYVSSWHSKFGTPLGPVDQFTQGWLSGAAAAIYNAPAGSFDVRLKPTDGTASAGIRYDVVRGQASHPVWASVGPGSLTEHGQTDTGTTAVDYEGIYNAVVNLPLVGDQQGLIPAFGVYLTHHYANYYNRISFEFERAMQDRFGEDGIAAANPLLVEAGHVCAFNTFGGVMESAEWDALVRPSLETPEDWVHGIVAVVNAFGWGRWAVADVSPAGATFTLHDDYESVGHLAMYGEADHAISYLAEGAATGIMNLVYRGDIAKGPGLTQDFYDHLFRSSASYQATFEASQACGDNETVLRVSAPR